MNKVKILHMIIYVISTLGILMGLDLILGAKITNKLNKILNKSIFDLDKVLSKMVAQLRNTVDTKVNIDDKIIKTQARGIIGILFILICVLLIFIAKRG